MIAVLIGLATRGSGKVEAVRQLEIGSDLLQRLAGLTVPRDTHNVVAEPLGVWLGLWTFFQRHLSASQIGCHLSVQLAPGSKQIGMSTAGTPGPDPVAIPDCTAAPASSEFSASTNGAFPPCHSASRRLHEWCA